MGKAIFRVFLNAGLWLISMGKFADATPSVKDTVYTVYSTARVGNSKHSRTIWAHRKKQIKTPAATKPFDI